MSSGNGLIWSFRDEMWKKNDYKSLNIESDDEEEEEEENEDLNEEIEAEDGGKRTRAIQYTIGDVTQPKPTDRENNIIIHCVGMVLSLIHLVVLGF